MYKVVVTGSRDWESWDLIEEQMLRLSLLKLEPAEITIYHGNARGADKMAAYRAEKHGFTVIGIDADWERYGRRAGYIRNNELIDQEPDEVIAFWLNESRGTGHTIRLAREAGIPTTIVRAYSALQPKKEKKMDAATLANTLVELVKAGATAEQIAAVVAAATPAQAPLTESSDELFDPERKDVEGNPLKIKGNGVKFIKATAKRPTCNRCGSGEVGWVESKAAVYPEDHPKAGKPKVYLAQAYEVPDGRVALTWQWHSRFCVGGDTPLGTNQEHREADSTPELPGLTQQGPSTDDILEKDREEPRNFDAFSHAEANELGSDIGMGFVLFSDIDEMAAYEDKLEASKE